MRPGRRITVALAAGLFLALCGALLTMLLSADPPEAPRTIVDETAPPEGGNQVEIRVRDKALAAAAPVETQRAPRIKRRPPKPAPKARKTPGPPGTFVGVVEDRDGQPVPEATVQIQAMRSRPAKRYRETTNVMGQFSITLPAGRYMVWAEATGYANSNPDWDLRIRSEEETNSKLVVRPANALRGRVLTSGDRPVARARVEAWGGRRRRKTARTDLEGRFALEDLPEGVYTVRVSAAGHVTRTQRDVPLSARKGAEVVVRVQPGGRLAGVVKDAAGATLPKALVFAYRGRKRLGMTETDAEGRYALEGVLPGPASLFARSSDYSKTARLAIKVAPGQLTPVDLVAGEAAHVSGLLTDPRGEPLARYTVSVREATGEIRRRARSDAKGRYTIKNLYPGRYSLSITRGQPGAAALVEAQLEVTSGALARDFTVPTGGGITGLVVGPKGAPLPRAGVYAVVGKDYRGQTRTDSEGRFRIVGLPADDYQLFVRVDRSKLVALQMVTVTEGAMAELRIQARPPAHYTGRLLDPEGNPVANVVLRVRSIRAPVERSARTDAEGKFSVGPLYDGDYRVQADAGSLKLVAHKREGVKTASLPPLTITITEGRSLIRDLRLTLQR